MKRFLTAAAVAAAIALPRGASAQCLVTAAELSPGVTAQLYSNVVEVVAPNGVGCYVAVRVRSAEGDVLAEQSGWLPDTMSDPDDGNDWRHGYLAFFLTDWSRKAEFFGLQPGQTLEVGTNYQLFDAPPGFEEEITNWTGTQVAEIGLTKVAPGEDAVAGFVRPRKGDRIVASFLGLDMNGGTDLGPGSASPICLGMAIDLAADGSFAADFTGECDLLRNGAMMFEYYKKNFRIYRFEHIPGIAAIINTPFALHSGQMYVPYRAHLKDGRGNHKAWSTSRPLAWLNLGLFQFSRHQSAVPIRKKDKIHLSQFAPYGNGVQGEAFIDQVPKFSVAMNGAPGPDPMLSASHAPAVGNGEPWWAITAPPGKNVCFVCVGCHTDGSIGPGMECDTVDESGKILLGPPEEGMEGAIAVMQKGNGNFYVAHKGLQNPLGALLSETPLLPSMYGFIPWLFCDALGIGTCGIDVATETPRLARAELAGFLKK